jgi:Ca2+/H+ antiporter
VEIIASTPSLTARAIVLLVVYALGLIFTLRTHAHLFHPPAGRSAMKTAAAESPACMGEKWSVRKA